MSGLDPEIKALHWSGDRAQLHIEYKPDPVRMTLRPTSVGPDPAMLVPYVEQAIAVLQQQAHPLLLWSTAPDGLGLPIVIKDPREPIPEQSTDQPPPEVTAPLSLYWHGGKWMVSAVDPKLELQAARLEMEKALKAQAASLLNNQARIYDVLQLGAPWAADLVCADYPDLTLGKLQARIRPALDQALADVQRAETTLDVCRINPAEAIA
jgi:hypothetical protein